VVPEPWVVTEISTTPRDARRKISATLSALELETCWDDAAGAATCRTVVVPPPLLRAA